MIRSACRFMIANPAGKERRSGGVCPPLGPPLAPFVFVGEIMRGVIGVHLGREEAMADRFQRGVSILHHLLKKGWGSLPPLSWSGPASDGIKAIGDLFEEWKR